MSAEDLKPRPKRFRTEEEVEFALESKQVTLRQPIEYRWGDELVLTTPGRVIFNAEVDRALWEALGSEDVDAAAFHDYINRSLTKRETDGFITELVDRYGSRAGVAGPRHDQEPRLPLRDAGRRDGVEERHRHPAGQGADPRRARGAGREGRAAVRARPHHRRGAPRADRGDLDGGHRRRRRRDGADALRAEPDLHDGQLRRPRLVQADPPARRHARPDGESEGRDHRAPDQGQLHGGPVGARVLHLDPRRPQGPRRHGAPHGRLGLPDAASRRRLAGRDHPRPRLRHRGVHRAPAVPAGRPQQERRRPVPRRRPAQAAQGRKARQDGAGRGRRGGVAPAAPRDRRGARGGGAGLPRPRALGAQVPQRVRRVPRLLRDVPRHGRYRRGRRRGRHRRRAVDRRAGHPADDADVPHRRRRRRGHHARPPARRRDLRGAEPEGRGDARAGRRPGRHRGHRPRAEGHDLPRGRGRERRAAAGEGVPAPAAHPHARHEGRGDRGRDAAARGLAQPEPSCSSCTRTAARARRRRSSTSSARCRRSTSRRASTSTTSTSS